MAKPQKIRIRNRLTRDGAISFMIKEYYKVYNGEHAFLTMQSVCPAEWNDDSEIVWEALAVVRGEV